MSKSSLPLSGIRVLEFGQILPTNGYTKILNNEHVKHLQLVRPLEFPCAVETLTTGFPLAMSDIEFSVRKPPPGLGSHDKEVAEEWLTSGPRS